LAPNTVGDTVRIEQNGAFALSLAEVRAFGLNSYAQDVADTLAIDIAGLGSNDFVNVAGTGVLDGTIQLFNSSGFAVNEGDAFDLLTATSITGSYALDQSAFAFNGSAQGFSTRIISGGNGQILQLYGLPEPSTFLIWSLGLLGLAAYARRRKR
jgi:MYXO-CTERM domain-containing protein